MRLEHENLEKIKELILKIIGKYLDLNSHKVFFFGSRVSGKSREASDIDIGIEGRQPLPTGVLSDIQDEIAELPVLYKIDVVDFADVNEKFKQIAKENVEFVN